MKVLSRGEIVQPTPAVGANESTGLTAAWAVLDGRLAPSAARLDDVAVPPPLFPEEIDLVMPPIRIEGGSFVGE